MYSFTAASPAPQPSPPYSPSSPSYSESGEEDVVLSQIEDGGDTDMNMSITYPPLNEESETLAGRTRKKVVVTADVASTPISAMQCEEVLPGMAIKNEDDCLYQPVIQIDDLVVISDDEEELERVTVKEEVEESERVPPSYRNRAATLQSCVVNSTSFCIVLSDDEEDSGLGM